MVIGIIRCIISGVSAVIAERSRTAGEHEGCEEEHRNLIVFLLSNLRCHFSQKHLKGFKSSPFRLHYYTMMLKLSKIKCIYYDELHSKTSLKLCFYITEIIETRCKTDLKIYILFKIKAGSHLNYIHKKFN